MSNFSIRTKMIDDCIDIKNYLRNWGLFYRLKFPVNRKEMLLKDILFPLLNDEDLYNVHYELLKVSSQPMA